MTGSVHQREILTMSSKSHMTATHHFTGSLKLCHGVKSIIVYHYHSLKWVECYIRKLLKYLHILKFECIRWNKKKLLIATGYYSNMWKFESWYIYFMLSWSACSKYLKAKSYSSTACKIRPMLLWKKERITHINIIKKKKVK